MKVSFYPDRSKSPNTVRTIWVNIYENGNSILLNTHEKVDTRYWDKNSHRVNIRKVKEPRLKGELNLLNQFLNAYENKITKIRLKMKTEDPAVEFSEIVTKIKNEFGDKTLKSDSIVLIDFGAATWDCETSHSFLINTR